MKQSIGMFSVLILVILVHPILLQDLVRHDVYGICSPFLFLPSQNVDHDTYNCDYNNTKWNRHMIHMDY